MARRIGSTAMLKKVAFTCFMKSLETMVTRSVECYAKEKNSLLFNLVFQPLQSVNVLHSSYDYDRLIAYVS